MMRKHFGMLLHNILAGSVRRWHTEVVNSEQTVAEHTFGVLLVLLWVVPREELTQDLLLAALEHDLGERSVGDVSARVKWLMTEEQRVQLEQAEAEARSNAGLPGPALTEREHLYLQFADYAEAALYAMVERSRGNRHAEFWLARLRPKLSSMREQLNEQAKELYHAIYTAPADRQQDPVLYALKEAGLGE